jgi:hypothetical protein
VNQLLPENARVLRRERRHAWRGSPTGRRSTRKVETTYGRKQKARDWLAARQAAEIAASFTPEMGQSAAGVSDTRDGPSPEAPTQERTPNVALTLVAPDPAGPPALTEPPKTSKPETECYAPALYFLALDLTPEPTSPVIARALASLPVLRAEGWTPGNAALALRRAGNSADALRNGPPLRLVRTGEAA